MHLSGYNLDAPHGHVNKEAEEYAIYEPAFCFIFSLFICRYISQKSYEDAIEIVHNGACLFLKHKQVIPVITITEFQALLNQQFIPLSKCLEGHVSPFFKSFIKFINNI